jgi:predicted nuclease of restriction endonuclease-like (RecB) superfamily
LPIPAAVRSAGDLAEMYGLRGFDAIPQDDFNEITQLIHAARQRAVQAVNTALIELYWQVGQFISRKIEQAEWGDGVVAQLAEHLARTQPGLRGFTRSNLFRMRKFYETYQGDEIVAPLVRQLPWSHNIIILNQGKTSEEREFYLRLAIREQWGKQTYKGATADALAAGGTTATYTDYKVGVSKDFSGYVLGLAYSKTNAKSGAFYTNAFGKDLGKGTAVLSLSRSF